jgi:hypothetical protein
MFLSQEKHCEVNLFRGLLGMLYEFMYLCITFYCREKEWYRVREPSVLFRDFSDAGILWGELFGFFGGRF